MRTEYANIEPFITKDGSTIRELMHPDGGGSEKQSVAEAIVPMGSSTLAHRHPVAEEIYHITTGSGLMTLDSDVFEVNAGDTVLINSGVVHKIENTESEDLKILCCCSPAYSHEDTELLE
ncbi:cupin domain-containing protein [Methanococcoides alaskense]|uniref:Mannose-6-phosphate isomerase-like protein (Cupin superfamily) n=1 Tax=Methanococcoides alaskense TaxID=325778 RepID=A0AA90U047_9EURY|nr:cupin domain-containing protein [Methanococcoides alaskense]MDR6223365.1 mannose-6-phosphate isomerase-like protein (cupin superfamily) [Methanococcoides alaskense]